MNGERQVLPELLDSLSPDEPRAKHSRRDLSRINAVMGHARIIASSLAELSPKRILDIGAGDGTFTLNVARRFKGRSAECVTLVDRQMLLTESTRTAYSSVAWKCEPIAADVFEYLGDCDRFDAITANLFLHHFQVPNLSELLALIAGKTDMFIACEPRRSRFALASSRMLWALGCNDVTRHDAYVSVLAGFRDCQLSSLWPKDAAWRLEERFVFPFSHVFKAIRTT